MHIRPIHSSSREEITLVAERMRETLNEVLGAARGESMYTIEWLKDRVCYHLDPSRCDGQVFVAVARDQIIVGHAIVRLEDLADEGPVGFFSTIFVKSSCRRQGIAKALMQAVESWLQTKQRTRIIYHTAASNQKLIRLFESQGYAITLSTGDMVRLAKTQTLPAPSTTI